MGQVRARGTDMLITVIEKNGLKGPEHVMRIRRLKASCPRSCGRMKSPGLGEGVSSWAAGAPRRRVRLHFSRRLRASRVALRGLAGLDDRPFFATISTAFQWGVTHCV